MSSRSEHLGRRLNKGIGSAEATLGDMLESTADRVRDAADKSSSWLDAQERIAKRARKELQRGLTRKKQSIAAAATAADRFVKHRSWTALGLTAVAAVIAGILLARR